jgi:hypothetical protein
MGSRRTGWLGVPAAALAALPACPACYPAYAALLSALGLGALERFEVQVGITLTLVAVAIGLLAVGARARGTAAPLLLGSAGASVLLVGKLTLGSTAATYGGLAGLVLASLWSLWPRVRAGRASCKLAASRGAR